MDATRTYDEDTVQLQLASGNLDEIDCGLTAVDEFLKLPLCGAVRASVPGSSPQDLHDGWEHTLEELWRTIKAGNLALNTSLKGWLFQVLKCRAIDCVRKRRRDRRNAEDYRQHQRRTIPTRDKDLSWTEAESEESKQAALAEFEGLPPMQRLVVKTFYDGRPATEDSHVLRDRVAEQTSDRVTVVVVMSELRRAIAAIKQALIRKGILGRSRKNERGEK